jgi:hypothetical protein
MMIERDSKNLTIPSTGACHSFWTNREAIQIMDNNRHDGLSNTICIIKRVE